MVVPYEVEDPVGQEKSHLFRERSPSRARRARGSVERNDNVSENAQGRSASWPQGTRKLTLRKGQDISRLVLRSVLSIDHLDEAIVR